MKTIKLLLALTCIAAFTACDQSSQSEKNRVAELQKDDKEFLALKDTAQQHLEEFITDLKKNKLDTNYYFIVKSDFVEGATHEHMWSVVADYDGKKFYGVMADSAYNLKNVKQGDRVVIKKEDVEDWAVFDNKNQTQKGNFSEKYLKSKM